MQSHNATQVGSRVPTWLKVLCGLVVALLLLVAGVFVLGVMASSRWHRYAASIRASGQPLTLAEIERRRPSYAPDRNGAAVISDNLDAISAVVTPSVDNEVLVFGADGRTYDLFSGIPDTAVDASRAFCERNRRLLSELRKLHDRRYGRFEIAHQLNPLQTLLPHLTRVRTASKLVRVDTMLSLIDGDVDRAVDNAVLQFRLAAALHTEPTMISRMVQIAVEAYGAQTVEQILRAVEPAEPQLRRMQEAVEARLADQTIQWALWGERGIIIETLEQMALGNISVNSVTAAAPGPTPTLPWLPAWIVRQNQLKAAQMYGELIDASEDPDELRAAARRLEAALPKLSVKHVLLRMLIPGLTRAAELHIRVRALLRCTRVALAAERFRLQHGRFPTSLDELVPDYLDAVPVDPFDGQALRVKAVETGLVIYSIAEDGTDDGGAVADAERPGPAPDEGLQLFDPKHRGVKLLPEAPSD